MWRKEAIPRYPTDPTAGRGGTMDRRLPILVALPCIGTRTFVGPLAPTNTATTLYLDESYVEILHGMDSSSSVSLVGTQRKTTVWKGPSAHALLPHPPPFPCADV
jgi:hypothetical protein